MEEDASTFACCCCKVICDDCYFKGFPESGSDSESDAADAPCPLCEAPRPVEDADYLAKRKGNNADIAKRYEEHVRERHFFLRQLARRRSLLAPRAVAGSSCAYVITICVFGCHCNW